MARFALRKDQNVQIQGVLKTFRGGMPAVRRTADFYCTMLCIPRTLLSHDICPSVCPSVCLSHAGILSKRLNISSNFFHQTV